MYSHQTKSFKKFCSSKTHPDLQKNPPIKSIKNLVSQKEPINMTIPQKIFLRIFID